MNLVPPTGHTPGIETLGAVRLAGEAPDGSPVTGLSGLAWDADEDLLYAVSDRGRLLTLRPVFSEGRLTGADLVGSVRLRGSSGRKLSGSWRDAEGLALGRSDNGKSGDTKLWVSFERHPRIVEYGFDGKALAHLTPPAPLDDIANYASSNQALEALILHPSYGLLMAPEAGLDDDEPGTLSFFDLTGERWSYPLAKAFNSSVVGMETLPDGRVLVLERAFLSVLWPMVISLRVVDLEKERDLMPETLAVLDGADGWRLDNFEGITRHRGNRFFMISDDNGNARQRTFLVYFMLPALEAES